jgi:hypothetical protein
MNPQRAVAFSALVGAVVIPSGGGGGGTTDVAAFDFGSGAGFQIDFVVQRSQTGIVWCDTGGGGNRQCSRLCTCALFIEV